MQVDVLKDVAAINQASYHLSTLNHKAKSNNIIDYNLQGFSLELDNLIEGSTNLQDKTDPSPKQCSVDRVILNCVVSNLFKKVNPYDNFAEEVS